MQAFLKSLREKRIILGINERILFSEMFGKIFAALLAFSIQLVLVQKMVLNAVAKDGGNTCVTCSFFQEMFLRFQNLLKFFSVKTKKFAVFVNQFSRCKFITWMEEDKNSKDNFFECVTFD